MNSPLPTDKRLDPDGNLAGPDFGDGPEFEGWSERSSTPQCTCGNPSVKYYGPHDPDCALYGQPIAHGLCVQHCWGAPPGKDNLECPYCNGTKRTKS